MVLFIPSSVVSTEKTKTSWKYLHENIRFCIFKEIQISILNIFNPTYKDNYQIYICLWVHQDSGWDNNDYEYKNWQQWNTLAMQIQVTDKNGTVVSVKGINIE